MTNWIDGLTLGRVDERLYEYVGDGPDAPGAPVEEVEAVLNYLAESGPGASRRGPVGLAGTCLAGFAGSTLVERRPASRGVGALGLLVESEASDGGADRLRRDARDFRDFARGPLAEGLADEAFLGELRGLLAEAEPVVARRRSEGLGAALGGRGGRRRRPVRRGEISERLGLLTTEAR